MKEERYQRQKGTASERQRRKENWKRETHVCILSDHFTHIHTNTTADILNVHGIFPSHAYINENSRALAHAHTNTFSLSHSLSHTHILSLSLLHAHTHALIHRCMHLFPL